MDSQLPRKGASAPSYADDRFDDSRHPRRTLGLQRQAGVRHRAGIRDSRRAWRTCAFCECARQHVGAGWTVAGSRFRPEAATSLRRAGAAALQGIASARLAGVRVVALDEEEKTRSVAALGLRRCCTRRGWLVNPRDHERRAEHAKTGSAAGGPCRRARLLGGAGLLLGGRDAMCHWQEPPRDESGFRAHGSNQRFHRLQRHTVLRPRRDQAAPTLTALPSARRSTSQSSRSTSGSSTTPLTRRTPRPARSAPAASATTGWTRRPRRRWRSRGASCASRACSATAPAPGARHRRADEPGREERGGKLHPRFGISGSSVASSLQ